jgi:hypothetical protein
VDEPVGVVEFAEDAADEALAGLRSGLPREIARTGVRRERAHELEELANQESPALTGLVDHALPDAGLRDDRCRPGCR